MTQGRPARAGSLLVCVSRISLPCTPSGTRWWWKIAISFGLGHVPIALYSANNKSDLKFKMIDKRTMDPVGYMRINKKSGQEVEPSAAVHTASASRRCRPGVPGP
ncbi:Ku protein [Hydrogenophaga sp.]|uniref:Ku protein n=1 Tax=Hydrogenophaga sp. TaxID=1904254 RepID=UPI00351CDD73